MSSSTSLAFFVLIGALIESCAPAAPAPSTPPPATSTASSSPSSPSSSSSVAPAPSSKALVPDAQTAAKTLFERTKADLVKCYEQGKKKTPEMTDAKVTFAATVDSIQRSACVIPIDDRGLTRETEECMAARIAKEPLSMSPAVVTLPLVIKASALQLDADQLGDTSKVTVSFESIETYHMLDAFDVMDQIEPSLNACVRGIDKSLNIRSILVGSRVAMDGRNQCALTTSPNPALPVKVADCLSGLLRTTKFPPPKGGPGLVLIPIQLLR